MIGPWGLWRLDGGSSDRVCAGAGRLLLAPFGRCPGMEGRPRRCGGNVSACGEWYATRELTPTPERPS
jgi:hypothetical protein